MGKIDDIQQAKLDLSVTEEMAGLLRNVRRFGVTPDNQFPRNYTDARDVRQWMVGWYMTLNARLMYLRKMIGAPAETKLVKAFLMGLIRLGMNEKKWAADTIRQLDRQRKLGAPIDERQLIRDTRESGRRFSSRVDAAIRLLEQKAAAISRTLPDYSD